MAVSTRQTTYGLLNAWAARTGVSIWQFNQVTGTGTDAPVSTPGNEVYIQPEREFLADAILQANAMAVKELRFNHRPVFVSETLQVSSFRALARQQFILSHAYVDAIGTRGTSVISAGASVVYSDVDGDGVDDTATITVSTSVTDATEVQVFFKAADSLAPAADERWQIEPLTVSISGGTATITGHRALFVKPSVWRNPTRSPNYNNASKNAASTTNAADFVTTVDVYRVYPDTTNAVTINANPYSSSPAAVQTAMTTYAGEAVISNPTLGLVILRPQTTVDIENRPVNVTINYRAGYPLDTFSGLPDRALETAIIRLTNSLMPSRLPMTGVEARVYNDDDAKTTEVFISRQRFNNPFGTKQGAVAAWDIVSQYRLSYPIGVV